MPPRGFTRRPWKINFGIADPLTGKAYTFTTRRRRDITKDCRLATPDTPCTLSYARTAQYGLTVRISQPDKSALCKRMRCGGERRNYFSVDEFEKQMADVQFRSLLHNWADRLGLEPLQLRSLIQKYAPVL